MKGNKFWNLIIPFLHVFIIGFFTSKFWKMSHTSKSALTYLHYYQRLLYSQCALLRAIKFFSTEAKSGATTSQSSAKIDPAKLPVLPKKSRAKGEPFDFVDYVEVVCRAGRGGDGLVSFLREKDMEFGGPDGGNGGHGGHVIFQADSKVSDLSHVSLILKAPNGISGQGRCCHAKNSEHLYVPVPLNTLIKRPSVDQLRPNKEVLYELAREGDLFIAARGGAGGHGNAFYLSNMVRKPLKAESGGIGERMCYAIEMRIMATAGFVGFPNVGKSTLLRAISRAKPKVAAYPFTTLKPSVGIVRYGDFFQLAVADIPGLVEGAHRNEGLGFSFLRHIMRCECILFVLDFTQGELLNQYEMLRQELAMYDEVLREKESAIVINKIDMAENQNALERSIAEMFPEKRLFFISGRYRQNLDPLLIFLREKQEQFLAQRQALLERERDEMMI